MTLRYLSNAEVTAQIAAEAKRILGLHWREPWGTVYPFTADGKTYVARLERHFHEYGSGLKPEGAHTGVSVLLELDEPPPTLPALPRAAFHLGHSSLRKLEGVDERLVRLVKHAIEITEVDFTILEGLRTTERQALLVARGSSQTMNSRHITGHAIDIAPWVNNTVSWRWPDFRALAPFIFEAARNLEIPIEWGGNWKPPHMADGPHWQIPWGRA